MKAVIVRESNAGHLPVSLNSTVRFKPSTVGLSRLSVAEKTVHLHLHCNLTHQEHLAVDTDFGTDTFLNTASLMIRCR